MRGVCTMPAASIPAAPRGENKCYHHALRVFQLGRQSIYALLQVCDALRLVRSVEVAVR